MASFSTQKPVFVLLKVFLLVFEYSLSFCPTYFYYCGLCDRYFVDKGFI